MFLDLEHPEIGWIERTGHPSWAQEEDEDISADGDDYETEFWGTEYEDSFYEEARERELFD